MSSYGMAPNKWRHYFLSLIDKNLAFIRRSFNLGWVVGFKANCPLVGPGPIGGVPPVGVLLRDSSPYLHEFRRKSFFYFGARGTRNLLFQKWLMETFQNNVMGYKILATVFRIEKT